MSAALPASAWEKEHLWFSLLALGFDPVGAAAAGKISTHLRLGVNMFDIPNKDAFHIVAWFLFSKLDQSRCDEIFRFCFPPPDKKADSEFRKHCYEWLRRISDECGNIFPQVNASLFLSPGGPKFIHLMFHFSRYVKICNIKADCADADISFPEAVNLKSPDLSMARAKYCVSRDRFLQNLQKEDLLIQELKKKAQLFTKRIRDLRYENADLDKQLQKMGKHVPQNQSNTTQRIEKVRRLWELTMQTLQLLQKEREVVDSVVQGHVDQFVMDGARVAVSIPRLLLEKVEREIDTLPVRDVYEGGKLNILAVIQLLMRALEMLIYQRQKTDKTALKLDLRYFEGRTKFQNETLLGLKSLRHKLKYEDRVSISRSISEKQQEWDLKWKACLGQSPLNLIKGPNPALDFLPPMSPLSFIPATEEAYKSSVFWQYPGSVPDLSQKNLQMHQFEGAGKTPGWDCLTVVTAERNVMFSNLSGESENKRASEEGSNADTPTKAEYCDFQILKYTGRKSKIAEIKKKRRTDMLRTPASAKREDPLKKAQEELAEEVANVVLSESPQNVGAKVKELEDLFGTLISDPFLTRQQLPRTPENLSCLAPKQGDSSPKDPNEKVGRYSSYIIP